MGLIRSLSDARAAEARVGAARRRLRPLADDFKASASRHPVIWLGGAFGAGFVMERLPIRPWRIPGLLALLGNEGLALVDHLLSGLGLLDENGDDPVAPSP